MKEELKTLVTELSNETTRMTYAVIQKFLFKKGMEGCNTSDLIDVIMSANFSSMFSCMKQVCGHHPDMYNLVNKVIHDMTNYLKTVHPITNVELSS